MRRSAIPVAMMLLLAVLVAGGCAAGPSKTPSPTPSGPLTTAELRYRLIGAFGPLWFCDPDQYPVARTDEAALAVQRFAEVQADAEAFSAILAHLGLTAGSDITADQKLAIYRSWKQLNAIHLEPAGTTNRFDYINAPVGGATEGRRTTGTIDDHGSIRVEQQDPSGQPPCPICLARGTHIATPDGPIAVEDIRVGMRVWSTDGNGRRIVATVVQVGQTPVPASHEVVRLALDDGRVVRASAGHPLADGRLIGIITAGDRVDGATVVSATLEPYAGGSTFDLLTDSASHVYFADGIPLGSTLVPGN